MEEIFSLGNVMLWNDFSCKDDSLTGEMAELFVSKILGAAVIKLKYGDVLYAVFTTKSSEIFQVETVKGIKYFRHKDLDDLKDDIKKSKSTPI